MSLLLMKRRQMATREDLEKEEGRLRRQRAVSDYSDNSDDDERNSTDSSGIEELQKRVRYSDPGDYSESGSGSSYSSDDYSDDEVRRERSIDGDDYDDDSSSSDWDDQRHEMQKKIQKKYYDPRLIKSIQIQKSRKTLDNKDLSLRKIESKKKLNAVWEGIIQKYSVLGEDDQGDVVNLKEMYIEENTGHIERLQVKDRTNIWDEFVDESEDEHSVMDPLNLLLPSTPRRREKSRISLMKGPLITPISLRRDAKLALLSRPQGTKFTSPPRFQLNTTKTHRDEEVIVVSSDSDSESEFGDAVTDVTNIIVGRQKTNDDPLNLLSSKRTKSSPSKSHPDDQKKDPFQLLTPQKTRPSIQPGKRYVGDYDAFNLLTPKRPRLQPSSFQPSTPRRHQNY